MVAALSTAADVYLLLCLSVCLSRLGQVVEIVTAGVRCACGVLMGFSLLAVNDLCSTWTTRAPPPPHKHRVSVMAPSYTR